MPGVELSARDKTLSESIRREWECGWENESLGARSFPSVKRPAATEISIIYICSEDNDNSGTG